VTFDGLCLSLESGVITEFLRMGDYKVVEVVITLLVVVLNPAKEKLSDILAERK
jgi:hypothetical protein